MKDLKNLCNVLNQTFGQYFKYDKQINTILHYSGFINIEITTHKITNEYVLHLQDVVGYVCVRCENEKTAIFHINNFLNN